MRNLATALLLLFFIPAAQSDALTLDEAVQAALQNHQRIEQFRATAAQSQAAVGSARAAFLPSIDLDYKYLQRESDPLSAGGKKFDHLPRCIDQPV